MTNNVTFFDNEEDLQQLTGLNHEELWDAGFNLDDMDCGMILSDPEFECKETKEYIGSWEYTSFKFKEDLDDLYFNSSPAKINYAIYKLLDNWSNYCVGYKLVSYNGKTYVTLHHA